MIHINLYHLYFHYVGLLTSICFYYSKDTAYLFLYTVQRAVKIHKRITEIGILYHHLD